LLFTSLALPVGAGKWLVDAYDKFYGGRVAPLVNPLSVDHYASVYDVRTAVRKKEWPKDGKLHSQGNKWMNAPREKKVRLTIVCRTHLHGWRRKSKILTGIILGGSGYCRCRRDEKVGQRTKYCCGVVSEQRARCD
jgi:hypothetical protein